MSPDATVSIIHAPSVMPIISTRSAGPVNRLGCRCSAAISTATVHTAADSLGSRIFIDNMVEDKSIVKMRGVSIPKMFLDAPSFKEWIDDFESQTLQEPGDLSQRS